MKEMSTLGNVQGKVGSVQRRGAHEGTREGSAREKEAKGARAKGKRVREGLR